MTNIIEITNQVTNFVEITNTITNVLDKIDIVNVPTDLWGVGTTVVVSIIIVTSPQKLSQL